MNKLNGLTLSQARLLLTALNCFNAIGPEERENKRYLIDQLDFIILNLTNERKTK